MSRDKDLKDATRNWVITIIIATVIFMAGLLFHFSWYNNAKKMIHSHFSLHLPSLHETKKSKEKVNRLDPAYLPFHSIYYGERQTLLFELEMDRNRVGNMLGFYFEALSCAVISGATFRSKHYSKSKDDFWKAFITHLPNHVSSNITASGTIVSQNIQKYCRCKRYCWQKNQTGNICYI